MPEQPPLYHNRTFLRALEGGWTRFEALLDRLTASADTDTDPRANFNPLYHLGTLSIVLLVILLITGIYLTVTYKPGPARAYASLQAIDATLAPSTPGWTGPAGRLPRHRHSWGLVSANVYFGMDTDLTVGGAEKAAAILGGMQP